MTERVLLLFDDLLIRIFYVLFYAIVKYYLAIQPEAFQIKFCIQYSADSLTCTVPCL